jgi:dimethylargininase
MRIGKTLYVGLSSRTNLSGVSQLAEHIKPFGYSAAPVTVHGCLHLKSGVCSLGGDLLIANRQWVDLSPFAGFTILDVASDEPSAANVLAFGNTVLMPYLFQQTADRIAARGRVIRHIDITELRKAEAGVTCSSLLFETH